MIGSRNPECVLALHTPPAYEDVLQGVVKGMTDVEGAGHVGGRNDYGIGLRGGINLGSEIALINPELSPPCFHLMRRVDFFQFASGHP